MPSTPKLLSALAQFAPRFARTDPPWRAVFHLETAAKLLKLLERVSASAIAFGRPTNVP